MSEMVRIIAPSPTPEQLARVFEALDQHFTKAGCSPVEAATAAFRLEGEKVITDDELQIAEAWFAAERVAQEASGLEEIEIEVG